MAAKLVAEEGLLKGLVLSFDEGEQWVIGRDPDSCQLLIEDPSASRKHLVCKKAPQGILVENLSTTNPVQVNNEEILEPRLLQNGDALKIGSGVFRFYAEAAAELFKEAGKEAPTPQGSLLSAVQSEAVEKELSATNQTETAETTNKEEETKNSQETADIHDLEEIESEILPEAEEEEENTAPEVEEEKNGTPEPVNAVDEAEITDEPLETPKESDAASEEDKISQETPDASNLEENESETLPEAEEENAAPEVEEEEKNEIPEPVKAFDEAEIAEAPLETPKESDAASEEDKDSQETPDESNVEESEPEILPEAEQVNAAPEAEKEEKDETPELVNAVDEAEIADAPLETPEESDAASEEDKDSQKTPDASKLEEIESEVLPEAEEEKNDTPESIEKEDEAPIDNADTQEEIPEERDTADETNEAEASTEPQPESIQNENEALPTITPAPADLAEETEHSHDSIFNEVPTERDTLAEINFGLLDTGRWVLKVISGPNNGAEFSMAGGSNYVIGTDPSSCDVVFHDTSVSRQHARISVSEDDNLTIEDLKSSNGTLIDGKKLEGRLPLAANSFVTVGTTSFVVFDREGEMQTIISPLLPSIVKVLQKNEKTDATGAPTQGKKGAGVKPGVPTAQVTSKEVKPPAHPTSTIGAFILIGIITGLFVIVGIGTSTLFKSEPVVVAEAVEYTKVLDEALAPFSPNVKYTFNKSTGRLLLVGHVLTATDKNHLLYTLQGLKFIKNLDDTGIVIDEYVWREINQILGKNPTWKGITIHSPSAGHFVLTGYLQTRAQAAQLDDYMSTNFPYLDLLEKRIVVDETIISQVNNLLDRMGFKDIRVKLSNGQVTLSGKIPLGKSADVDALLAEVKTLPGIRNVRSLLAEVAIDQSMVNVSDRYEVTGSSNQGGARLNVIINGRILMKGDVLDGMTITSIQAHTILLEKGGTKYRIDFSK